MPHYGARSETILQVFSTLCALPSHDRIQRRLKHPHGLSGSIGDPYHPIATAVSAALCPNCARRIARHAGGAIHRRRQG
jgi:hypothetical protein